MNYPTLKRIPTLSVPHQKDKPDKETLIVVELNATVFRGGALEETQEVEAGPWHTFNFVSHRALTFQHSNIHSSGEKRKHHREAGV